MREESTPDLSNCPNEIIAADPNAELLWSAFLKRAGISMSSDGRRVIDNGSGRAWVIRILGIPSLIERLASAANEIERARVWWRESVACSAGDSSIPDLTTENLHLLNPFIITAGLKFTDPRAVRLARSRAEGSPGTAAITRGRPRKSIEEKRQTKAAQQRRFRASQRASRVVGKIGYDARGHFSVNDIFPTTAALDSAGLTGHPK